MIDAMSQSIEEYIQKARKSGLNNQQIKDNLTKAGWLPEKIDPILAAVPEATEESVASPQNPQSAGPQAHFSLRSLPDKAMNYMWSIFRRVEK